jgi:hypothetical protein
MVKGLELKEEFFLKPNSTLNAKTTLFHLNETRGEQKK